MLLPAREQVQRVTHVAAMPFGDVPGFMRVLAAVPGVTALALRFTILCACRTSDVLHAPWEEFDLAAGVWTIPAERMKARRGHTVPLSDAALAVLAAVPRVAGTRYVFPGARHGRPLNAAAMLETLRQRHPSLTVHGFRSSFRDWAAECTPHPAEVAEMALAHVVANKVERAYRRGELLEKRRLLMADWAAFCEGSQ
jgi:integrase